MFIDTNVLIYLHSSTEPQKKAAAVDLFGQPHEAVISTQVLNEFMHAMNRKNHVLFSDLRKVLSELYTYTYVAVV